MGLLSPHLTMDLLNRPIALVSSSEVSGGKRGMLSSRPRGRSVVNRLKGYYGFSSFLFQHLQPFLQCSTYLSHSHSPMQFTATSSPPRQVRTLIQGCQFHKSSLSHSLLISHTLLPHLGFLQPGGALSLQKQMEHANQQTGFSDSVSVESWEVRGRATLRGNPRLPQVLTLVLYSPLCVPCTPKLYIQPLDFLPPPSFLCRCNRQGR